MRIILQIVLFLGFGLFSFHSEAGFCWKPKGESKNDCQLTGNERKTIEDSNIPDVSTGEELKIKASTRFKFRSYCHNCGSGEPRQDWSLGITDVIIDPPISSVSYRVDTDIKLGAGGTDQYTYPGDDLVHKGYWTELKGDGWSGNLIPTLTIPSTELGKFSNGLNRFTVTFEGKDRQGLEITKYLEYTFLFNLVKPPIQVEISGLDPIELGTFPNHKPSESQDLCVFTTDGEPFSITATSSNGGGDYFLASNLSQINYTPYFAMKQHSSGMFELSTTPIFHDKSGNELRGSSKQGCTDTGENMTLKVELVEDFQTLSTKPAGNYTDTLTLTVAAE